MRWIRRYAHGRADRREHAVYQRAHKRFSRLDVPVILDWCDQVGSDMARSLNDYRRDRDLTRIDEAADRILCLGAAMDVLSSRG